MKKVMLLGDSIRLSYQPAVQQKLAGAAEVWGPADNCRFAKYTLWETAAWLGQCGHSMSLCIPGAAAGAVYVAFAAPVERVSALPSARIRILPEAAVRQILRTRAEQPSDPEALVHSGVIDAFLDSRPDSYAAAGAG